MNRLISLLLVFLSGFPGLLIAQGDEFTMRPVGQNFFLDKPWDLLYSPDGYLWVTEREAGKVVRINPADGTRDELVQVAGHSSTASQDGLLGMALHPEFEADSPFVYLSDTYLEMGERRQRILRYTFIQTGSDGSLTDPQIILDALPSSNDHNSGRLIFGPDGKLYYTIGDQGGNQRSNYCNPILSQVLPAQAEIDSLDRSHYPGKTLRLNTDGSIPDDNPVLGGVKSHIFSYGHRNAQGIVFGSGGILYSDEHGPDTDDEVNMILPGGNYGWPRIAGFQDDQAYDYCNWSSISNCDSFPYVNGTCPPGATFLEETTFSDSAYQEPLFSLFAVPDNYNFNDPACQNSWICRPNVAPSGIAYYGSESIPGWKNSLLVVSLKRGRVYRLQLDSTGQQTIGDTTHHFYTPNRYRDLVVAPDGKTFYVLCGETGRTSDLTGLNIVNTSDLQHPGNILEFTLKDTSTSVGIMPEPLVTRLWPNPAHDIIQIETIAPADIHLHDPAGRVVRRFKLSEAGVHELNLQGLTPGIYLFSMENERQFWHKTVAIY